MHELRAAVRGFLRRPYYPLVAVTILALGLSASIAVFTYINGFFQPFPGVDSGRLVRVFGVENEEAYQHVSYLDFLDLVAGADAAFEGLAAVQPYYAASVRLETSTDLGFLEAVSGDYFSVLGIEMKIGRGLAATDDRPGADPAAVISHAWWQNNFNADPSVIGSTIYLNYRPFTVVGVASPTFLGSTSGYGPDIWIPIAPFSERYTSWTRKAEDRDVPLVRVYGRLRVGAREEQGRAELAALAAGLDEQYPRLREARRFDLGVATWIDPRYRVDEWSTVRLMVVVVGGLLILVCANVANLLLSVAARRQREMSVRAALGASPGRLVRQVMIENVLLAGFAGVVALLLAGPLSRWLGAYFARPSVWGENVAREATVDLRVLAFALGIALLTGVVAGLLPAFRAWRRDLLAPLRSGANTSTGDSSALLAASRLLRIAARRLPGVRDLLVSTQVALSIVLLVVAGLVLRTFVTVADLDPGFAVDRMVVTHISTSSTDLTPGDRDRFFRDLVARLGKEPWVRSATVADYPLLSPHQSMDLLLDGQDEPTSLIYSMVIPGFFEAMGIEVREGRGFVATDEADSRDVAMINEQLARRYFAGQNPVGRRICWPAADDGKDRELEIVGVVHDTKTEDFFEEPPPTVYFSYPQHPYPTGSALLVTVKGDPRASVPRLHRWLRDFEPYLAIVNVVPYKDVVRGFLYAHRMNAEMFSLLALLGLVLSAVGIFSVVSLAVSRRTREIGIRVAIGADRSDIGRLILGRAFASVALGLVLGLGAALALTELMRSLLYGVEPTDPFILAGGVAVLVVATLAAAYLPARRAAALEPTTALHHE